jgi:hypothetical protein
VDQRLVSGAKPAEALLVEAPQEALEQFWPLRRRFLFIVAAATLCWVIPAIIAYLLLVRS